LTALLISSVLLIFSCKNEIEITYDESDIPPYDLPELLINQSGDSILNFDRWNNARRTEILDLFNNEIYGAIPDAEYTISFHEKTLPGTYFQDRAQVRIIDAIVKTDQGADTLNILYIHPAEKRKVPVFVGLNFGGNHTVDTLGGIPIHQDWVSNSEKRQITNNRASAESRGASAKRWPIQKIIDRGYGVATAYYGSIDPDYDDGFENGFHPLFADVENGRDRHTGGSISMWAKGMSFIADFLVQDSVADANRLIAIGHSRLGKTALWCGANDTRFSAVISNNSGCGGAALSMRGIGETVERINTSFPHWFNDRFNRYNGKEKKLPVDQHMLLALMAPRPVYVASATEDQWADPHGEFLALQAAVPVYELFGFEQDFPETLPAPNKPWHGITGYHLRTGKHDITEFDWIMYMNWCDRWLPE
jgi:hypothetical protein